ncbi:hypothetical protein PMI02_00908 [Novosphingobium sp. AP12]|nr:hypothetical protein PMI02_00908 [Novosphingobium sp. AP12]
MTAQGAGIVIVNQQRQGSGPEKFRPVSRGWNSTLRFARQRQRHAATGLDGLTLLFRRVHVGGVNSIGQANQESSYGLTCPGAAHIQSPEAFSPAFGLPVGVKPNTRLTAGLAEMRDRAQPGRPVCDGDGRPEAKRDTGVPTGKRAADRQVVLGLP